jgi:hypothetical protein
MKRSQMILLFAGGTTLAGVYAYNENQNCRPDAMGQTYCSSSSSSSHGSYSSSGGSNSSSHSGVAHGGFGGMGAAHGGGS